MPIYEYRCGACGHEFEILQRMSDQALTECPSCGKSSLSKLVSAAGFQLKGSGWYVTDFRDSKKSRDGTKASDANAPEGSSAGAKSESHSDSSADAGTKPKETNATAKKTSVDGSGKSGE